MSAQHPKDCRTIETTLTRNDNFDELARIKEVGFIDGCKRTNGTRDKGAGAEQYLQKETIGILEMYVHSKLL